MSQRKVLITGTAGFIGFHLAKLLLAEGFRVQGYDGMTDYYDGAEYLSTCLLSVFGQIYPDCEVILVDYGSTDQFRF